MFQKLRQLICCHENVRRFERDRVYQECMHCLKETPGWRVRGVDMPIAGAGVAVVGGVGLIFTTLAWWKLQRANRVLRAAMRLHDEYMGKLKGTGEHRNSTA